MRMLPIALTSLLLQVSVAQAGSIGVYSSADCTGSSSSVEQGQSLTLYVMANTEPGESGRPAIDSAEYRISGLPPAWTASVTPGPHVSVSIGNPFADGVVLAFDSEYTGCLLLHTLTINATTGVENVLLSVTRPVVSHAPFGYPTDCPWLHYPCGAPCDTSGSCATIANQTINSTVSAQPTSWSAVRAIFR